jgi:hypothetical protein
MQRGSTPDVPPSLTLIVGMYLKDAEGTLKTTEVTATFVNGKPRIVKGIVVMKGEVSSRQPWPRPSTAPMPSRLPVEPGSAACPSDSDIPLRRAV